MAYRDLCYQFKRGIVLEIHPGRSLSNDPAMTVAGVFTCTDVGDDEDSRGFGFYPLDGQLDHPAGIVCFGSFGILPDWYPEEEHGANPSLLELAHHRANTFQRIPELTGHGGDRRGTFCNLIDEKRHHEIGLSEVVLFHKRLDKPSAEPSHSLLRKHNRSPLVIAATSDSA